MQGHETPLVCVNGFAWVFMQVDETESEHSWSCLADDEDISGEKKAKYQGGFSTPLDNDFVFDKDWAFRRRCSLASLLCSRLTTTAGALPKDTDSSGTQFQGSPAPDANQGTVNSVNEKQTVVTGQVLRNSPARPKRRLRKHAAKKDKSVCAKKYATEPMKSWTDFSRKTQT